MTVQADLSFHMENTFLSFTNWKLLYDSASRSQFQNGKYTSQFYKLKIMTVQAVSKSPRSHLEMQSLQGKALE